MNWLITTKSDLNAEELARRLANYEDCEVEDEPPIPLGDNEQVFKVSGPRDLARKMRRDGAILAVHPSSEMELY